MKKVLLVGGSGMLGSNIVVSNAAFDLYPTYLRNPITHPRALQLDISDRDEVLKRVEAINPEVIVHAGGMTKPTACEKEPAVAHSVNVEGTAHLVEATRGVGARFIFLSSDLVFDGSAERYDEDSPTHPLSVYGHNKVEGEELVRTRSDDFAIVRTTVMYGWSSRYTESMAEWVLRGLKKSQELNMYHDQYRQFILINDLVAAIFELIEYSGLGELNGHQMRETIHVVGPELISRYEFAQRLAQTFGLPAVNIRSIPFESVPQAAFTPKRLSLDTTKATRILRTPISGVDDGLRVMAVLAKEGYRGCLNCIF
ncbi:MAG: SDR family oxidoreductase [Anaerolineae bacterium]|nr:SDR family oxidoreductase [Anaerolineae bacterium]